MELVYIPDLLNAYGQKRKWDVQDHLDGLESLTPVNGQLQVVHNGNFLEVQAIAETIVTLTCDRCLRQYNHRLEVSVAELIWLQEPVVLDEQDDELEVEVAMDDLVETLSPKGHFSPVEWLYEQMCLALPQRQLCDADCPGITVEDYNQEPQQTFDQRWASLQALKENLPN
ncbi:MAG: YceD family protein [Cyanobacteria bacterium P01_F01_bin.150]